MATNQINNMKSAMRQKVKSNIAGMSEPERFEADRAIIDSAMEALGRYFLLDSAILAYMPLADEVDITPIMAECIERDIPLALPRTGVHGRMVLYRITDFESCLEKSEHGMLEPRTDLPTIPWTAINLAFIPGRAFSKNGDRLGRGMGIFDRNLCLTNALLIAPAYDCQIYPEIPCEEHDRKVDVIITQSRIIETKNQ